MFARNAIALGFLAVAIAGGSRLAGAEPVLLSNDYRYAADTDKTFAGGDATVSASQAFARGLRLAAPEAQDAKAKPAEATAAYSFKLPLAAKSLAIEVGYRADPKAKDKDVAGLLVVRNQAMEEKAAEAAKEKGPVEKPGFLGNTYFLKGGQPTTTVTLPMEGHVVDGILEVRLSAAPGQAFDALYIQVSAYRSVETHAAGSGPWLPLRSYAAPGPLPYGGPTGSMDPFFWRQFLPPTYVVPYRDFRHHHKDKD